ncbi:flavocytochrome c [Clostridium cochlearium]|jgi:fumarate reductase flavoprotein subunit|uniref:flavocytochrome c n=1 Tax=Clostridium cochlearium TaxID=1494 RepID=UPI000B94ABB5|nr:flavocytochrome c [Clostridium cochlearium]NSJ92011.1 flavocytochrome c [Coprococcus sp. MSK.21.13]MBE6064512.1 flavocytochrome c [Clostridium cochlearium]MCG4581182.1 flavocytochrome c [Clostridium cochlearium]SNV78723.1 fumarate reductase flavoprotein subunit [Clostridium cochlearium]STA92700.1 fumarate reductase flavoprotein subunit [Clostridium cochlearium]
MKKLKSLKKILCLVFCLTLVTSLIGCQSKDDKKGISFKPGTYQGTSKGHNGELKLEVTVDKESIKEIKMLEHKETPGISDPAIERIPKAIINDQSLAVDTISGATVTSHAIISAVTNALKQSEVDMEALKVKKEKKEVSRKAVEHNTDVVVIGGGGAGLAAAVSANQKGAKVILVEKMPRLGGNTILSGGAFNAVDPKRQKAQGIEDSIDKHYTQTYEGGDKLGNPELIRTLVENAYPAVEWLEGLGMKFNDKVFTVLGGMWPRAHKPSSPVGTGFIDTYSKYIDKNDGIKVLLDTEATEIIMKDGKAVGIKAKGLEENLTIHAKNGVVIAAGGFAGNSKMVDKYNKTWPSLTKVKSTNHPGATGDGIVLAEAVGANLVGMENLQLLPMGDPNTGSLSGNIEQGVENRIFVNKSGKRFVDEGARRDVMTKALLEQEDAYMWVVLDHKNYPTPETTNNFNETIEELIEQGRAFKADTLEELAKKIKVDPANLVKSVEEFNKAVDSGKDSFGRTLFDKKIDTAPFYAGPRMPTVHHTMGGIEINKNAEVLGKDGKVIPGLYAAGEVTGGIHGSNRLGGNALADITVFGKIAGENAAKAK